MLWLVVVVSRTDKASCPVSFYASVKIISDDSFILKPHPAFQWWRPGSLIGSTEQAINAEIFG